MAASIGVLLVDELLTLAKQGGAVGDTEAVSFWRLAESCWETGETGDATLEIASEVTVRADEHRLHELLANLVANAVTHGRPESSDAVTVTVGATAVGFYVADDGVGIPADRRDRIFDPGYSDHPQGDRVRPVDRRGGGGGPRLDSRGRRERGRGGGSISGA